MFKQLIPIIGESQKVQIKNRDKTFSVKKQDLYKKVEILCQNKEDKELNFILGMIIAINAFTLKDGTIYCYFQRENLWENKPEAIIQRQSDLYRLLK